MTQRAGARREFMQKERDLAGLILAHAVMDTAHGPVTRMAIQVRNKLRILGEKLTRHRLSRSQPWRSSTTPGAAAGTGLRMWLWRSRLSLRFHDSADELRSLAYRLVDKVCLEHQPNMRRLAREPDDAEVFDAALRIINRVCDLMEYGLGTTFVRNGDQHGTDSAPA